MSFLSQPCGLDLVVIFLQVGWEGDQLEPSQSSQSTLMQQRGETLGSYNSHAFGCRIHAPKTAAARARKCAG